MKISELEKIIEEDSNIDESDLSRASLNIPYLHAKYMKILNSEVKALFELDTEYSKIKAERTQYYLGKAPEEVYKKQPLDHKILKTEVETHLNSDEQMISINTKRSMQKHKVEMIKDFIKTLAQRGYLIKNAIDFLKFKNGVL